MSVSVAISVQVKNTVNTELLSRGAAEAFSRHKKSANVDILVCGDVTMRRINRESLAHDYTTDVLSWLLDGDGSKAHPFDVALTVNRAFAAREARSRGIAEDEELLRYVVHGCLHALGHDDHDPKAREEMWTVQERIVVAVLRSTDQ